MLKLAQMMKKFLALLGALKTLTTLHHAPEPQVTHRANPMHHEHQMVNRRHFSWRGGNPNELTLHKNRHRSVLKEELHT